MSQSLWNETGERIQISKTGCVATLDSELMARTKEVFFFLFDNKISPLFDGFMSLCIKIFVDFDLRES